MNKWSTKKNKIKDLQETLWVICKVFKFMTIRMYLGINPHVYEDTPALKKLAGSGSWNICGDLLSYRRGTNLQASNVMDH